MGLPYAFASHFAPEQLMDALYAYRALFRPSTQQAKPHAVVLTNVVAADTDEQAWHLFTTLQQQFTRMRRNTRGQLPPPIDDIETFWTPQEKVAVMQMLSCAVVGSMATVEKGLQALVDKTGANELMMAGAVVTVVPVLALFLALQRFYLRGILLGGVKG